MSPAPVGVEHNGTRLVGAVGATGTRAGLPVQLGVVLSSAGANLLSAGGSIERERGEGECPVHGGLMSESWMLGIESFWLLGTPFYTKGLLQSSIMGGTL